MKNVLAAVTFCAVATAASAQAPTPTRQPWEWTDAERIAERTNPDRIRERVEEAQANILATQGAKPGTYILGDSIDGKTHPELFLPVELFGFLVRSAVTTPPDFKRIRRRGLEEKSRQRLPANFWQRLESITASYAASDARVRAIVERAAAASGEDRERLDREAALENAGQCRELYESLERARAEFGRQFFDRFLYETIPRGAGITFAGVPTAAQLTEMNEGCK